MITRPTSIKGHGPSWTELELSQHDTFLLSSISTHASSRKSHAPGGRRPDPGVTPEPMNVSAALLCRLRRSEPVYTVDDWSLTSFYVSG
jgi:hypothetical protein